jgi:hypothetical protein
MDPFRRLATFTVVRDAGFVALAAATFMLAFSFHLPLAFFIGASVALAFAVFLTLRAWRLDEARFRRSEAWRILDPHERPRGQPGLRVARAFLDELLLRTAKTAAMAAIVLSSLSLIVSMGQTPQSLAVAEGGPHLMQASTTTR